MKLMGKRTKMGVHFGTQRSVHPTAPVLLTKESVRNDIIYDSQPPLSLYVSNSRTKPAGFGF